LGWRQALLLGGGRSTMADRRGWMAQLCATASLLLCLVAVGGCASWVGSRSAGDSYYNSERGYRIARLDAGTQARLDAGTQGWKAIGVEGADLAYQQRAPEEGQGAALAALISECGRGANNLSVVSRQLLIGIRNRAVRRAAPVALRGSPGWMQVFDTIQDGAAIRVKTVSVRDEGCTFDWVLVAPGAFRAVEDQFDGWWSSFVRDDPAGVEDSAGTVLPGVRLARAGDGG
jgi:hypothetical protein